METLLSIMSFMGGIVIGGVIGSVVTLVTISIAVGLKNDFNNFHARVLPKAKPTKVRKAEIYRAVAKSLKESKLDWCLKFIVSDDRALKTPVANVGGDFFYIRTGEASVVHRDLVEDLRKRGYEVGVTVKGKGDISADGSFADDIDMIDKLETITIIVKVK